jgi:hypothetical protein
MGVCVMVMMVIMVVVMLGGGTEQLDAMGGFDDCVGTVQSIVEEILQTAAGNHDGTCAFNGPHLRNL